MFVLPGSSHSTSKYLENLYNAVFRTLFFPPSADFTQPLLEAFMELHDQLLDDSTLYTAPTRFREIGVEIDWVFREFQRLESLTPQRGTRDEERLELNEIRKSRLRSKLQFQVGQVNSRESVMVKSQQRIREFDEEMKKSEEDALKFFKNAIRRSVIK